MTIRADDAVWRRVRKAQRDMEYVRARVGVLGDRGGDRVHKDSDMTLADLAAVHELGSRDGRVPERSFLRSTFHVRVADQLRQRIADSVRAVLEFGADVRKVIGALGAWGATEVKNTISQNAADSYGEFPYPPLADSTIAAKGSSVPLVDTGQMLNAITWQVVDDRQGGE